MRGVWSELWYIVHDLEPFLGQICSCNDKIQGGHDEVQRLCGDENRFLAVYTDSQWGEEVQHPRSWLIGFLEWLGNKEPVLEVVEDNETTISDMSCYSQEHLGKDSGGNCYAKRQHSVLKIVRPPWIWGSIYEWDECLWKSRYLSRQELETTCPFLNMGLQMPTWPCEIWVCKWCDCNGSGRGLVSNHPFFGYQEVSWVKPVPLVLRREVFYRFLPQKRVHLLFENILVTVAPRGAFEEGFRGGRDANSTINYKNC